MFGGTQMSAIRSRNKIHIIGRELEIDQISGQIKHLLNGEFASCAISGDAGVGKTYLLNHVAKGFRNKNVKYIYAKYNHYNGSTLNILKEIISQLVNLLLMESDDKFYVVRNKLKKSINPNITLITSICPEAKVLLGKHNKLSVNDYSKHEFMYNNAFMTFLHILSEELFPIVVHIDDIQWADETFTNIINSQGKVNKSLKMLLAFSFRNDSDGMRVFDTISELFDGNSRHLSIQLNRLDYKQSSLYIKSSLVGQIKNEDYTLERIYKATLGNPYYIQQIIDQLLNNKSSFFNENEVSWTIDKEFIEKNDLAEDIVHTLVGQIKKGIVKDIAMLKILACVVGYAEENLIRILMENPDLIVEI